ncbi:MAG: hypothetical protein WDN66_00450 [Candidatus Saccharibacteria bacterium]
MDNRPTMYDDYETWKRWTPAPQENIAHGPYMPLNNEELVEFPDISGYDITDKTALQSLYQLVQHSHSIAIARENSDITDDTAKFLSIDNLEAEIEILTKNRPVSEYSF